MTAAIAKRIVVGYDGSEAAERALDRAAELAGYGTTVTVISVAPSDPAEVERVHGLLEDARARLTAQHVSVRTLDPIGDPVAQIVGSAAELGADLVVVGSRGLGTISAVLMGSVSRWLVKHADVPVTIVTSHHDREPAAV